MNVKRISSFDKVAKAITRLAKNAELNVGWFEGAKYGDGTSVAYVAIIHEFGFAENNLPPRPFMRPTIASKKKDWAGISGSGVKQVLAGKMTVAQVLTDVGLAVSGDIAKTITEITSPELEDSTIASKRRKLAKGGGDGLLNKPLVETSLMLASLSHEVTA